MSDTRNVWLLVKVPDVQPNISDKRARDIFVGFGIYPEVAESVTVTVADQWEAEQREGEWVNVKVGKTNYVVPREAIGPSVPNPFS